MKRFVCFLLAMILIMGMVPATAVTASAASERATSDKAIQILKGSATFYEKKGTANKIGYGTHAGFKPTDSSIPKTYLNYISREDADALLRNFLKEEVDKEINKFTKDYNVDLSQQEHDALAVHLYRTGALDPKATTTPFVNARIVKTVSTAADRTAMINAFVSHYGPVASDQEVLKATLNVALAEAAMYLYGDYGYNGNNRFAHAILDMDGNMKADTTDVVVAYVKGDGYELNPPNATTFLGWHLYDSSKKAITGAPLTKLTKDHDGKLIVAKKATGGNVAADYTIKISGLADMNLYDYGSAPVRRNETLKTGSDFKVSYDYLDADGVKWVFGSGTTTKGETKTGWVKLGKLEGTAPDINKPIATATIKTANTKVYPGATADGASHVATLQKDEVVNVYEMKVEKTDYGNKVWGKITYMDAAGNPVFGWINLVNATVNDTKGESGSAEGQTGKIANDTKVNIRSSAGVLANNWITSLEAGTKVTVLEMNADRTWAKIKWSNPVNGYTQGWVYMHYVQLDSAAQGSTNGAISPDVVLYTAVVTSNINLNVRQYPDVYATRVKSLPRGTKVNVYDLAESRNMKWGRIGADQWVCVAYLSMNKVDAPATNNGSNSAEGVTSTQGTVTTTTLNILKNYNNNAEKVGALKKGDVVTILEKNTEKTETGSRIWGRIEKDGVKGWINLAYVELKTVTTVPPSANTGSSNATPIPAIISDCISVNVRDAAGVYSTPLTKLNNGTAVTVVEQITHDNAPWARIKWNNGLSEGWACMYYITLNAGTGSTNTDSNGIINGTSSNTISATGYVSNAYLNVRGGAGLGFAQIGTLNQGTKVTLFEQAVADGMIWGRISYNNTPGWVCMSYITVENASTTGKGVMGTIARCFAKANVRSAPGTNNALVSTVNVGSRVEVFETKTHGQKMWARIPQGWVCMDYVLLDSELPEGTILDATTEPTTVPTTEATVPATTINKDNEVKYVISATISTSDNSDLNVRNDASSKSDKIGSIKNGEQVQILAVKNNGAELWGRIDQYATAGWVNMAHVSYSVAGFVNTENQAVYADPDTSSTVKGNLPINTEVNIKKLTVNGETVYGWYDNGSVAGWIPMGRISKDQIEVIPVIEDSTVSCFAVSMSGKTNAAIDAYDVTNGSKVVCKLKSGVTVYVNEFNLEAGVVWGKIAYKKDGVDTAAWINMNNVTYSMSATVNVDDLNVRTAKNTADETNILGKLALNDQVQIIEISFAGDGTPWAKIANVAAELNGGYVGLTRLTPANNFSIMYK